MNNVEFPNATASALMGLKSMPSRFESWLPWLVSIYWQPLWWRLLWGWLIQQCIVLKSVGCTRTLLSMDAVWNLRERVYSCSARVLFGFCWVWLHWGFILFGFLLSTNSGKLNTLKLIPLYVHNRKSSGELFSAAFFGITTRLSLSKLLIIAVLFIILRHFPLFCGHMEGNIRGEEKK